MKEIELRLLGERGSTLRVNIESTMASRYTIKEALEAILDDFGLSDGGLSDEQGDVGEPVLRHDDVNVVGDSIVNGPDLVDHNSDEDESEASKRADPLPGERAGPLPGEHERSELSGGELVVICHLMMIPAQQSLPLVLIQVRLVVLPGDLGEAVSLLPLLVLVAEVALVVGAVLMVGAVLVVAGSLLVVVGAVLVVVLVLVVGDMLVVAGAVHVVEVSVHTLDLQPDPLMVKMVAYQLLMIRGIKKEPTAMRYEYNRTPRPSSHIDRNSPRLNFFAVFLPTRSGNC